MTRIAAAALVASSLLLAQQPTKRLLKIEDMHRFHDVRDAQISPDGQWVAYTVNTVDAAADKSDTDVWITSWDGTQQLRMTTSPESEGTPRWSPDGRYLSFLSSRPGKARGNQVWLLDRSGGEAQQLTDVKGRLQGYEWSPDGKRLALVVGDPDPDAEPPAGEGAPGAQGGGRGTRVPKPIVIDRYKYKQDGQGYLLSGRHSFIYLFDLEKKTFERLTTGKADESSPTWSPD